MATTDFQSEIQVVSEHDANYLPRLATSERRIVLEKYQRHVEKEYGVPFPIARTMTMMYEYTLLCNSLESYKSNSMPEFTVLKIMECDRFRVAPRYIETPYRMNTFVIPIIKPYEAKDSHVYKIHTRKALMTPQVGIPVKVENALLINFDTPTLAMIENTNTFVTVSPCKGVSVIGMYVSKSPCLTSDEWLSSKKTMDNTRNIRKIIHRMVTNQRATEVYDALHGRLSYLDYATHCLELIPSIMEMTDVSSTKIIFSDDRIAIMRELHAVYRHVRIMRIDYPLRSIPYTDYHLRRAVESDAECNSKMSTLYSNVFSTVAEPIYPFEASTIKSAFIQKLENTANVVFSTEPTHAFFSDIVRLGLGEIYTALYVFNDATRAQLILTEFAKRIEEMLFAEKKIQQTIVTMNEINDYLRVIEKKIGTDAIRKIESAIREKPYIASSIGEIEKIISPSENKIIRLEIQREQDYRKAFSANKCRHRPLINTLLSMQQEREMKKALYELEKMMKDRGRGKDTDNAIIKCKVCDYDMLCPHKYRHLSEILRGTKNIDIIRMLQKYVLTADTPEHRNKRNVTDTSMYCRLCGESLPEEYERQEDEIVLDEEAEIMPENESLNEKLTREIIILLKFMRIGLDVNTSNLISEIKIKCYNTVDTIVKALEVPKTIMSDTIKSTIKVYMGINILAYMITLVISNPPTTFAFRDERMQKKITDKTPINAKLNILIDHCVAIIENVYNAYVARVPSLNTHIAIKEAIADAYNTLAPIKGMQILKSTGISVSKIIQNIIWDPIFIYACYMSGHDFRDPNSINILTDSKRPYKSIIEGKTRPFISLPEISSLKSPKSSDMRSWNDVRLALMRIKVETYRAMTTYVRDIPTMDTMLDPSFKQDELDILSKARLFTNPPVSTNKDSNINRKVTRFYDSGLGYLYNADGHRHKWSIVDRDNMSNDVCSVCNINREKSPEISDESVISILKTKNDIESFYNIFVDKCPKDNLGHTFTVPDNVCSKCGLSSKNFMSTEYFVKYSTAYDNHKKDIALSEKAIGFIHQITASNFNAVESEIQSEAEDYVFSYGLVLEVAKRLHINQHRINALGGVSGIVLKDVLAGAHVPPQAVSPYDTRAYIMQSFIRTLLIAYTQLRFHGQTMHPSADLTTIIQKSGINRQYIAQMHTLLPPMNITDFEKKFNAIQKYRKPQDLVNYCTEMLCRYIIAILDDKEEKTAKLRTEFCKWIMDKIMAGNEMTTKYTEFNRAQLYKEESQIKETMTQDMGDNIDFDQDSDKLINTDELASSDPRRANEEDDDATFEKDAFNMDAFDADDNDESADPDESSVNILGDD